jgi:uncharacterized protein YpmB
MKIVIIIAVIILIGVFFLFKNITRKPVITDDSEESLSTEQEFNLSTEDGKEITPEK